MLLVQAITEVPMELKDRMLAIMSLGDAHDMDAVLEQLAPDAEWITPSGPQRGHAAIQEWLSPFWRGFSSFTHTIDHVVQSADTAYAEGVWTGVHDGPLVTPEGELPPTGRTVSFRFAIGTTGDADKLRSVRVYFDQLAFLGQLGVLPEPAGAASS
jgi:ketosteroid isomerase-like protein